MWRYGWTALLGFHGGVVELVLTAPVAAARATAAAVDDDDAVSADPGETLAL